MHPRRGKIKSRHKRRKTSMNDSSFDFGRSFGALEQQIEDGFRNVNLRIDGVIAYQKEQNGRVNRIQARIDEDENHNSYSAGRAKGVKDIIKNTLSIVGFISV